MLSVRADVQARQLTAVVGRRSRNQLCNPPTAMHLLRSGVPFNMIALWLGHASIMTTHRYVEAYLAIKEEALARDGPNVPKRKRCRCPDL